MTNQKVQLQHPDGKKTPAIAKTKYDNLRKAMLSVLREKELTHTELMEQMKKKLAGKFDGSIPWCSEAVNLDLEAQKLIKRTDMKPQTYKIV